MMQTIDLFVMIHNVSTNKKGVGSYMWVLIGGIVIVAIIAILFGLGLFIEHYIKRDEVGKKH